LEVRKCREGDRAALARLGALAFGAGASYWEDYYDSEKSPRLDLDLVYVVEEGGEARATAAVLPMEIFVDGGARPMGGVAAVAAHPAYRRRGYAGELMRTALDGMRERGMHLSMLDPFSHSFYRAYGYELATEAVEYTLSPSDLPTSPQQKRVRAHAPDDLPKMVALLEEEAARRPCCVRRGEGRWRQVLAREGQEAVVYEDGEGVEGYLLYEQRAEDGEPPRTLRVSELVARTPAARSALISFAAAYDPHDYRVSLCTPRGEPLHPFLRDSHVEARLEPGLMLRLVDVEGALGWLDRKPEVSLVLEVSDDVIPANAGEYTVGDGGVTRGAEAGERVKLDVRQLARLYAGYLPARQLAWHGLLEPGSQRALTILDSLFPVGDPYVSPPDHF
jgi:predicted acetyltransferase